MSKKLYKVELQGLHSYLGCDQSHDVNYVVADDPNEAYTKVRELLLNKGYSSKDTEFKSISLIADEDFINDVGYNLYT